jgi:hypothetical protein
VKAAKSFRWPAIGDAGLLRRADLQVSAAVEHLWAAPELRRGRKLANNCELLGWCHYLPPPYAIGPGADARTNAALPEARALRPKVGPDEEKVTLYVCCLLVVPCICGVKRQWSLQVRHRSGIIGRKAQEDRPYSQAQFDAPTRFILPG